MRIILPIFVAFILVGCGNAPHPKTLILNREGMTLLRQQSFTAALNKSVEALRYNPYQAETHLNMGLAFEGLEQPEKAIQSYRQAQGLAKDPLTKFMALFNEAQLLGKAKKVDEALGLYQKALESVPTSKEAKTNIELLTQDQQGKGGGEGENKDDQDKGEDKKDPKNPKDDKGDKDQEKPKDDKKYEKSTKYKPRKFEGKDLSETDVKKILGELRQQEQKIRAEFNRKEQKEPPRDKDW